MGHVAIAKDAVTERIKNVPDDAGFGEIMCHLHVKQKIIRGKQQLPAGQSRDQPKVEELAKLWLG